MSGSEVVTDKGMRPHSGPGSQQDPTAYKDLITAPPQGARIGASPRIRAIYIDGCPHWEISTANQLIHIDRLIPHPWNPRKFTSKEKLEELKRSISEEGGIHSPIVIIQGPRPGTAYIVSGHRRLKALQELGAEYVPCKLIPGDLSEAEVRRLLIVTNENHEKPALVDGARAVAEYMKASGKDAAAASKSLGISKLRINRLLKLLTLSSEVQELINQGKIPEGCAFHLPNVFGGPDAQLLAARRCIDEKWSAVQTKNYADKSKPHLSRASSLGKMGSGVSHSREWIIGGEKQISVTVHHSGRRLPNEYYTAAILHAFQKASEGALGHVIKDQVLMEAPLKLAEGAPSQVLLESTAPLRGALLPRAVVTQVVEGREMPVAQTIPLTLRVGAAPSVEAIYIDGAPHWEFAAYTQLIHRDCLRPHPQNPRKHATLPALKELEKGILDAGGIHTPMHITYGPEEGSAYLLSGHRRHYVGGSMIGYDLFPCQLIPERMTEAEVLRYLITHNDQQERPAPIDLAQSLQEYLRAARATYAEAAAKLGIPEKGITALLGLLRLPEDVQEMINAKVISQKAGEALATIQGSEQEVREIARRTIEEGWSVARIKVYASRKKSALEVLGSASTAAVTERFVREWRPGGEVKMRVRLTACGNLEENEIKAALHLALAKVSGRAGRTDTAAREERVAPGSSSLVEGSVKLGDLWKKDAQEIGARLQGVLGELSVKLIEGEYYISEQLAAALQCPLDQKGLERLHLNGSGNTNFLVANWMGLNTDPLARVTPLQVFAFWIWSYHEVEKFGGRKIRAHELYDFDTKRPSGVNATLVKDDMLQNMKRLKAALDKGLLALGEARLGREKIAAASAAERFVKISDLEKAGVTITPKLVSFFKFWLRKSEQRTPAFNTDESEISLTMLNLYLADCQVNLRIMSGGVSGVNVGKDQLAEKNIYFSRLGGSQSIFSSEEVAREIDSNLRAIQGLLRTS